MFIWGSVIQKCSHGVYEASDDEVRADRARYCGFCTPSHYDDLGVAGLLELIRRKSARAAALRKRRASSRTKTVRHLRPQRNVLRKVSKVRRRK